MSGVRYQLLESFLDGGLETAVISSNIYIKKSSDFFMRIIDKLPNEIKEKGIDLRDVMGINSLAWKSKDVQNVAQACLDNGFAIIGGDVIEENVEGSFSRTYDNWFLNKPSDGNWADFINTSVDFALERVQFYTRIHKNKSILFKLVFSEK